VGRCGRYRGWATFPWPELVVVGTRKSRSVSHHLAFVQLKFRHLPPQSIKSFRFPIQLLPPQDQPIRYLTSLRAMSQFISEIWASVFEPGANRSVLIATYTSFAALQATLFALLLATRSWHFVFLSIVCACLWSAVVWFVNELEAVKKVEAEAERIRELRKAGEEITQTKEMEKKER